MPKFRKKPVVIEAIPIHDVMYHKALPQWVKDAYASGVIKVNRGISSGSLSITTLEGVMTGPADDWLIRGVQGELYACKKDIFEATYDPVSDDTDPDAAPSSEDGMLVKCLQLHVPFNEVVARLHEVMKEYNITRNDVAFLAGIAYVFGMEIDFRLTPIKSETVDERTDASTTEEQD